MVYMTKLSKKNSSRYLTSKILDNLANHDLQELNRTQDIPFKYLCLVLLQVPKCFVPVQIFWVSPKIWLHLVPLQKLLCLHKNQFYWMQIIFLSGTKCLWLAQYVNKCLVWRKKYGTAQKILGPVKGQGISS